MAQAQYTNIGGAESLWVAHTVHRGERHERDLRRDHDGNATSAGTRRTSRAAPSRRTSSRARRSTRTGRTRSSASCPPRVDRVGDMAIGYTQVELDHEPADQVRRPARRRPDQHAQPERADADQRHRRAERQLRRLDLHPLGRLQRHGARPERLRVLDDRRVLRDDRAQPPDPHRLVPLPGLHDGRERHALGHGHRRHETRSPARPSRSAAGRRRRTGAGVLVHRPGRHVSDETASKPASTRARPRPSSFRTAAR